jgi:hypothetical protein
LAQGSILSDELFRELMAVGQVDILVGLPTLDNAATVGEVVRAVHVAFATHFRRERTVLVNVDGGSTDGTPEAVRDASLRDSETLIASQGLRTMHRISTPYHGLPGKGAALRTLFAAAELLQARAVTLFDPDVTSIAPDWLARLVRPVYEGFDFVAPVYPRHPLDGPLVTQLVRPFVRAAYGHVLREPLASEFACSGRFASHCLAQDVWDRPFARYGIDLWLTGAALAGGFGCAQAPLGPRVQVASGPRPALPEVFRQVVGSLFTCLELHESYWLRREVSEPVPSFGAGPDTPVDVPGVDPTAMVQSFRAGVRDLAPVLQGILGGGTLERIVASAQSDGAVYYPDDLWTSSMYEAAAAYRRNAMHREHLVQALVPLYLGRTAAFVAENAGRDPATVEQALEALCRLYESAKPELVRQWSSESAR